MHTPRRIYVTQYDCTWSLYPEAWRQAVEAAVAGKEFSWDDFGKRLARPLSAWEKQFKPLDWDEQDWANALADLEEQS